MLNEIIFRVSTSCTLGNSQLKFSLHHRVRTVFGIGHDSFYLNTQQKYLTKNNIQT